jgi:adenine deaminase
VAVNEPKRSASADLVIRNGNVVDVFRRRVRKAELAVRSGRIVRVGAVGDLIGNETRVLDAEGGFLTPGLIDTHAHCYHANLAPTEYARACLRCGTTAVAEGFYGQGQIRGIEAVRFFYDELRRTPLTVLFVVPVLAYLQNRAFGLPPTPEGVTGEELIEMLDWEGCVGIEEPPWVPIQEQEPVILRLVEETNRRGLAFMGHGAGLAGEDLAGYAAAGVTADHECITAEEAVARLEHGMMVSLRETPIARNQEPVQRAVTELGADPSLFMFSSDVPDAVTLARVGHVDEQIRIAIRGGIDPLDAVRMATLNAARYYRVEHRLGSLTPGRQADIVLVHDLQEFRPAAVIAKGMLVAGGEDAVEFERPTYPAFLRHTVKLARPVTPADLRLDVDEQATRATVRVIGAESLLSDERRVELTVTGGAVDADVERDVLKIAMFDRYGRWDTPAIAFVQGHRLRRGALGQSYNPYFNDVMVVGTNDADMAVAANAVARLEGGFVAVADGEVLAQVALPLCGLISDQPLDAVVPQLERLYAVAADELGAAIPWPFHNLAFVALGGELPRLKLSDRGLFDVIERKVLPTVVAVS